MSYNVLVVHYLLKERRRQERLALERQLEEDQRQQALLVAQAAAEKSDLLLYVAQVRHLAHWATHNATEPIIGLIRLFGGKKQMRVCLSKGPAVCREAEALFMLNYILFIVALLKVS